jgi:hypothetical protein
MSTVYYGQPANIDQVPTPVASVNISSSTNATPIVITTSTSHGLQTGMAVIVNGHAVNTAANGIWIAHVTGGTTFSLYTFAGVASVGSGVGGATGTVQGLQLPGLTLPEDAVDDQDAASVNVPFEGLADMTAWLAYKVLANMTVLGGGSMTFASGASAATALTTGANASSVFNGAVTLSGATIAAGTFTSNSTATFNSAVVFNSTTQFRAAQRPADAATINVSSATSNLVMLANPGGTRDVKIADSTKEGDWIVIVQPPGIGSGKNFNVKRNDGTLIAELWGADVTTPGPVTVTMTGFVQCVLEGGVWRGGPYSGYIVAGGGW